MNEIRLKRYAPNTESIPQILPHTNRRKANANQIACEQCDSNLEHAIKFEIGLILHSLKLRTMTMARIQRAVFPFFSLCICEHPFTLIAFCRL